MRLISVVFQFLLDLPALLARDMNFHVFGFVYCQANLVKFSMTITLGQQHSPSCVGNR